MDSGFGDGDLGGVGEKAAKVEGKPNFFVYSVSGIPVPADFSDDPGLVFAPHVYGGSIAPVSVEGNWAFVRSLAEQYKTAIWAGEYGWWDPTDANLDRLRTFGVQQDQAVAGGAWWQWRQACGDPHSLGEVGGTPDDVVVQYQDNRCPDDENLGVVDEWRTVVARPYPRAAPGRIVSLASDGEKSVLTLNAERARTGGLVDLWVPGADEPRVSGTSIAVVRSTRVDGGWRVDVMACAPSYQVFVGTAEGPATSAAPKQCTAA